MLDIGGSVGAGLVYFDGQFDGVEVDIRPAGGVWDGTHTAVRERRLPAGSVYAALFQSLPEGQYEIRLRPPASGGRRATLEVEGGRVTELWW